MIVLKLCNVCGSANLKTFLSSFFIFRFLKKQRLSSAMGAANCIVRNNLDKPLTIMTFNNADTVFQNYNHMYQTAPKGDSTVEAAADAWGLKVGIVYGEVGSQLLFRTWYCPNGSTLSVNSIYYDQIDASGCEHIGTNQIGLDQDTMTGILDYLGVATDVAGVATNFYV
jgi:hypothetical protein